jgi:hypothetical protein
MANRPPHSDVASDAATPAPRRVLMVEGVRWDVRLFTSRYDRRSRPDLLFESYGIVRRVRNYPPDWHMLSDEDLFAVSAGR